MKRGQESFLEAFLVFLNTLYYVGPRCSTYCGLRKHKQKENLFDNTNKYRNVLQISDDRNVILNPLLRASAVQDLCCIDSADVYIGSKEGFVGRLNPCAPPPPSPSTNYKANKGLYPVKPACWVATAVTQNSSINKVVQWKNCHRERRQMQGNKLVCSTTILNVKVSWAGQPVIGQ